MKNQIVFLTEEIAIPKTVRFPVWTGFRDEQQVWWNHVKKEFEFREGPDEPWKRMEWNYWMNTNNRADIIETLTHLLALVKASK